MDKCHRTRARVDVFHDRHNVYVKPALKLHAEMKIHRLPASLRQGIGTLTFASKREYVPLQAADLLAYLVFRRVMRGPQAEKTTDIGRAASAFVRRFGTRVIGAFDESGLENHLRMVLPRVIREGRMPSQVRVARRRAEGRASQQRKQSRPKQTPE